VSENPPNPLDSLLTEFALGPSWARAKSEPAAKHTHESPEREHPQRRRDDRGDNRGRREGGDRREGGNRRGQRDDRGQRDGGNRRDFQKGRGRGPEIIRREEFIAPAEGVNVSIVPDKAAIQLVCKEIQQVARVYPLFDIAEIILAERARCRAIFEISEKHEPFHRCKIDDAIFLTKEEALRHLLDSPWKNRYIAETTVETDPPKGNFQSVARCGISGKLLGPPNYHGYQTEIRRMHREFFPEMAFESYTAKIRTDRSEDAVGAWMDSMKTQTRWRILSDEESAAVAADLIRQAELKPEPIPAAEEATPDAEPPAEEATPAPEVETVPEPAEEPVSNEEAPAAEEPAAESTEPEPAEEAPAPEEPAAPEVKWFTDRAEFERALAAEVLGKAYQLTRKAKVSAAIPARNLSPGLLARLKATGSHHRKHPAILIPEICKILESEHMPVFKRKGKLFTGPARPHALALDAVLAERPGQMVKWIRENPPAKLEGLWQAMLPEGSTAPPQGYAADLFWLIQQGHILLYTDDTLVVQDPPPPQQPKKPKQPKKKAAVAADCIRPAEPTPSSEEKSSEAQEAPTGSDPTPDEQSASEESAPETIETSSEATEASNEITEAVPEAIPAPEETPPASTEPAPEPIEPTTEAPAEVTEPEEAPAAIQEPSPETSEPEEEPAKDPLP
jgi:hypothetical protein